MKTTYISFKLFKRKFIIKKRTFERIREWSALCLGFIALCFFCGAAYDSKRPEVSPFYVLIMAAIGCAILGVAIFEIARGWRD